VAVYLSFKAYKEFKGTAEDQIGREAFKEQEGQNIIQYGIIDYNKQQPPQQNENAQMNGLFGGRPPVDQP
jgi:hypothetical protein